jgi:RNA polymerase primary sigma factor
MRGLKITPKITDRWSSKSFGQYLQDIKKIEGFSSATQEYECALKAKDGDQKALEELVYRNLKFVVSVAKQYNIPNIKIEDLINEGNIGLVQAANKFEPNKGFKFISYAVWYIRRNMNEYISKNNSIIRLPMNKINDIAALNTKIRIIEQQESRPATSNDLLDNDNNIDDLNLLFNISNTSINSLDSKFGQSEDSGMLLDVIADENTFETDTLVKSNDMNKFVEYAMYHLNERQQNVITLLYGLNGEQPHKLVEIAKILDMTNEQVRQTRDKAHKLVKFNLIKKGAKAEMFC